MPGYIPSKLDADQVLRRAYDETENRLRVDAEITASIGTVDVILDATQDNVSIADPTGTNFLVPNADGSINANISGIDIDAASGDNIAISDGVEQLAINTDGSINTKSPEIELILQDLLTELEEKTEPADAQNIRALSSLTDSVSVPGVATESTLSSLGPKLDNLLTELQQKTEPSDAQNIRTISSGTDSISVPGVASETTLSSIDSKLTSTIDGLKVDVSLEAFAGSTPDNVQLVGSIDGTKTGSKYGFVNNIRQQILSAQDRQQAITYADFGTKDQRVTRIEYTSSTFTGFTLRKDFVYTLVGTKYRRDDINWSVI